MVKNTIIPLKAVVVDGKIISSEMEIPKEITEINDVEFAEIPSLRKIVFHDNVKKLGRACFSGCNSLHELIAPKGLEVIGEFAFLGCEHIKKVEIRSDVRIIGRGAFFSCFEIDSIIIPAKFKEKMEEIFEPWVIQNAEITYTESIKISNNIAERLLWV